MPDQGGISSYDLFLITVLIFGWILPSTFENCFSQQVNMAQIITIIIVF